MARPIKVGIDYFPLDTSMDSKIELYEAEMRIRWFCYSYQIISENLCQRILF